MEPTESHRDGFVISTEKDKLQLDEIYLYLSRSYWAHGRTREAVALSLQHSLCFGLYKWAADRLGACHLGLCHVCLPV